MKQIKSTNSSVINASLEPIYLYDGIAEIKNIFEGGKKAGSFELTLCYGNVKQIHGLLANMTQGKLKTPKIKPEV